MLLALVLLLLTGLEQRRRSAVHALQHQRRHLQALNQSISALEEAPYLNWQPATMQWQCRQVAHRQLCLRKRTTCTEMALLRVSSIDGATADGVTLYRFVRQKKQNLAADSVNPSVLIGHPTASLFWVAGGWLDACPEKQPRHCW